MSADENKSDQAFEEIRIIIDDKMVAGYDTWSWLLKNQNKAAINPTITWLTYVPLVDYDPRQSLVIDVIKYLAFMGSVEAIPAIQRVANTKRNFSSTWDNPFTGGYSYDDERREAGWAIKDLNSIKQYGYVPCILCNASGLEIGKCKFCDGSGIMEYSDKESFL